MALSASVSFGQTSFTSLSIPSSLPSSRPGITAERHLQATSIGSLYANSAFAHGYRHGYDEGYRVGDLDIQIGREPRMATGYKEAHQAGRGYCSSFGSRELFEKGYEGGFRGGYSDAVSGAEYRVRQRVESAATGLAIDPLPANRRAHFDKGFAAGYESAQTRNAPSLGMTIDYVEQYCRKTASGPYALEYCSGFSRGYQLGIFNAPTASGSELAGATIGKKR